MIDWIELNWKLMCRKAQQCVFVYSLTDADATRCVSSNDDAHLALATNAFTDWLTDWLTERASEWVKKTRFLDAVFILGCCCRHFRSSSDVHIRGGGRACASSTYTRAYCAQRYVSHGSSSSSSIITSARPNNFWIRIICGIDTTRCSLLAALSKYYNCLPNGARPAPSYITYSTDILLASFTSSRIRMVQYLHMLCNVV